MCVVGPAWRRVGSRCIQQMKIRDSGQLSTSAYSLLPPVEQRSLHGLAAVAAAGCRTASAAHIGTRAANPAATAMMAAMPTFVGAWRQLSSLASQLGARAAKELQATTCSNAAFYGATAGRSACNSAVGGAASAKAATSCTAAQSGAVAHAAAQTAGSHAHVSSASAGIGLVASRAAFSTKVAQTAAPQQSVWVSDPGALKQAAGVGPSSGTAGVPHFGYGKHVVLPIVFSAAVAGGAFLWALLLDEDRRTREYGAWIFDRGDAPSDERHGLLPDWRQLPWLGGGGDGDGGDAQPHPPPQAPAPHMTARQWAASLPLLLRPAAHYWASLQDPTRTLTALVAVNVAVALLWRLPPLRPIMARNFAHTPGSGRVRTLLASAFSHRGALHLACNMLALWSFGHVAFRELGREQFLAFYVSSAVLASLASHLATVWPLVGANIPAATLLQRVQAIRPSLGASGAVIALFAMVAARQPERQVALIFAPDYPFSIGAGFMGMVGLDLAGTLLGWRLFDHTAHLGGAVFGSWYARWGEHQVWENPAMRRRALAIREEWRHLGEENAK